MHLKFYVSKIPLKVKRKFYRMTIISALLIWYYSWVVKHQHVQNKQNRDEDVMMDVQPYKNR